ncbi:MAG: acyltransferase [Cellvibrionales bacterium TMED49]|nr:acyltransferase [Porticoccaceae bacterium]OUU38317.1 MAG: acyltransferase [Cellvibrionales bacterium TMED49]
MTIPEQVPEQLRSRRGVIPRWIGILVLNLLGWRIEGKIPDLNRSLLIGAPHTSNWDFVIAMASILAINLKMFWLAKHTIFVPLIRPIFNWLGGIPTNRNEPRAVVDRVINIAEKEGSVVIGITPEGTRKKVVKWKTGFLRLSRNLRCPIIMVGLSFSTKRVIIGDLFYPTGNNSADLVAIREYYQQFDGRYPDQF